MLHSLSKKSKTITHPSCSINKPFKFFRNCIYCRTCNPMINNKLQKVCLKLNENFFKKKNSKTPIWKHIDYFKLTIFTKTSWNWEISTVLNNCLHSPTFWFLDYIWYTNNLRPVNVYSKKIFKIKNAWSQIPQPRPSLSGTLGVFLTTNPYSSEK